MKTLKMLLGAGAVACTLMAGSASANDAAAVITPPPPAEVAQFRAADRNHDGVWARSEVPDSMQLLKARFARYDDNGDQRLTLADFRVFVIDVRGERLSSDDPIRGFGRGAPPMPVERYTPRTQIYFGDS
ncbi:hypothetical protein [Dyella sp.]|jgi:hypothetical protein|uniref:hypothetical protein n=1 Tax=Dyella sp. TaxID=1869338 RepID=UPI002D787F96|nr:hypothetical protein [Dyella sp.]HET6432178.1 hypothetical protein [Dyella sp.]